MPYSVSDSNLPDAVKKLSAKRKRQWVQIWNSAYSRAKRAGKSDKDAESSAFAQANGVVGAQVKMAADDQPEPVSVASFALDLEPYDAGDIVYRPGLLFKAGEYPDKAFQMTASELKAAAENFAGPLAVDLEHVPTVLQDKLGELVHVEASDDGQELHGIVALPKWLDGLLDERKVSATWDRATKSLAGLALVRNPRVSDAALMAAFNDAEIAQPIKSEPLWEALNALFAANRHNTYEGRAALQGIHDAAARAGAVCKMANSARMSSSHEATAIQRIHDLTTEHGAQCSAIRGNGPAYPMFGAGNTTTPPKEGRMSTMFDRFMAWLGSETPDGAAGGGSPPAQSPPAQVQLSASAKSGESETERSLREQLVEERERRQRLEMERIHERAAAFSRVMIVDEGRVVPAGDQALTELYEHLAIADGKMGAVTFADGHTDTYVGLLEKFIRTQDKHHLTEEAIKNLSGLVVLAGNSGPAPGSGTGQPSQDELDKMLAMTPGGRATLAARKNQQGGRG